MRNHSFVYAPFLIGLTLLLGVAFAHIKAKSPSPPPQAVAITDVLR